MTDAVDEYAAAGARAYAVLIEQGPQVARLLLHPYLPWTRPDGTLLRGRTTVLALLADELPPTAPRATELRDGQIYRWDSTD